MGPARRAAGFFRAIQIFCAGGFATWLAAASMAPASAEIYFGTGGTLCGQFIAAQRKQDPLYYTYSQWMMGYVSGMNLAWKETRGSEPLATIRTNNLLQYAGEQCAANPDSTLVNVATAWFMAIPKQPVVAKDEPKSGSTGGSLILNLDRTPDRKPLLERH